MSKPGGSREELLDAGLEMLREFPLAKILRFLTAREVSKRIGMTTGVFYHHFPSQQDYCDALVARLFDPEVARELTPSEDDLEVMAGGLRSPDYQDTIDVLTQLQEMVMTSPAQHLHVWLSARRGAEPALDDVLRGHHARFDAFYSELVEEHLARRGRKVAPPYEALDLAYMFNGLADGLTLRPDSAEPDKTLLYAYLLVCMAEGASVDVDSDETFDDVISRLETRASERGSRPGEAES